MDTYDRTLRTLKGFVAHVTKLKADADEDHARAIEHAARVVHVLKELSTLCTHLNAEAPMGAACAFYTPARNEGLDDDKLFLDFERDGDVALADVPPRAYWGTYLRRVLKGVRNARQLHTAAIEIQMRAVRSMAVCVAQHIRRDFASNCTALCMLDHLSALTGPAANSSVKNWVASPDVHAATPTEVRRVAESESVQVFDATLTHITYFAGPVEDFVRPARRVFCAVLDGIANDEVRETVEKAIRESGDQGRRELLQCSHAHGRTDSICDDVLFLRVSQQLASFRQFIEYESLFEEEEDEE